MRLCGLSLRRHNEGAVFVLSEVTSIFHCFALRCNELVKDEARGHKLVVVCELRLLPNE